MCLVFLIDFVDGIKENKVTVFKSNKTERTNLPNKWIHRKSDNVLFPVLENMDLSTSRHVAFTDKKPILPQSADIKKPFTVNLNDLDSVAKRKQNKTSKNKKSKREKIRTNVNKGDIAIVTQNRDLGLSDLMWQERLPVFVLVLVSG